MTILKMYFFLCHLGSHLFLAHTIEAANYPSCYTTESKGKVDIGIGMS